MVTPTEIVDINKTKNGILVACKKESGESAVFLIKQDRFASAQDIEEMPDEWKTESFNDYSEKDLVSVDYRLSGMDEI